MVEKGGMVIGGGERVVRLRFVLDDPCCVNLGVSPEAEGPRADAGEREGDVCLLFFGLPSVVRRGLDEGEAVRFACLSVSAREGEGDRARDTPRSSF